MPNNIITRILRDIQLIIKGSHILSIFFFFSTISILHFVILPPAIAWDRPYNNGANWGGTGLMEVPNARVIDDGYIRLGAAQVKPYRWWSVGMGVFPGLEVSGRITQITTIKEVIQPGFTSAYGYYKDKAVDVKYQILPESKVLPAIAVGVHDFWGTRIFPSEYLVVSRQYYPLDITLGIASKRLKGSSSLPFLDDYGYFGGVELALNDRLHFIAEYAQIEYEKDHFSQIRKKTKYPINFGMRARLLTNVDLGLSYQRGNTFGLMLHIRAELGENVLPHRPDPPALVSVDRRPFDERDQQEMIEKIHEAIKEAGFTSIAVYTDGRDIIAEFGNGKYLSNQKAVGRVLRILLFHSPNDTEQISAVLKRRDIPILKISVKPEYLEKYLVGEISDDIFFEKLMKIQVIRRSIESEAGEYIQTKDDGAFQFGFRIKPDIDYIWNDPSKFFMYTLGVKPYVTATLWKGAFTYIRYTVPLYSNMYSPQQEPLSPNVIRSDFSKYFDKDNMVPDRLLLDQVVRLSEKTFGRLSLGYLEAMYAGVSGEIRYFPWEGRMTFGIKGDLVRKRVPQKIFELMDINRYSLLGVASYYFEDFDISIGAQYGRFLAGDVGWMFDIGRRYSTGASVGAFASFTDTDNIDKYQPYWNKGYNNKGVFISIPLRSLMTTDSRRSFDYRFSPWTRDVGSTPFHWQTLYGFASDLMPAKFKAKLDEIKE